MASEGACWLVCATEELTAHKNKSKNKVVTLAGERCTITSIIKHYGKKVKTVLSLQDTKNSPYINEKTQDEPVLFTISLRLISN
jgi:hypothetical protein